ncbi:MAG: hypothetical protein SPI12_07160 [Actinomycetaceae bacterium]|nr:hypothetical protein [Actinomycetaceae bacterium]MDY6083614.1 hypothetical protein [Actinomycetaceae bacterium]
MQKDSVLAQRLLRRGLARPSAGDNAAGRWSCVYIEVQEEPSYGVRPPLAKTVGHEEYSRRRRGCQLPELHAQPAALSLPVVGA